MWLDRAQIIRLMFVRLFSLFMIISIFAVWIYLLAGCSSISRNLTETERCRDLEARYQMWGGLAIASTAIAGSGVLATPFPEDKDVRLGLAIASASVVAFGAAAAFVKDDVLEAWSAECDLSEMPVSEPNPKTTVTVETSTTSR